MKTVWSMKVLCVMYNVRNNRDRKWILLKSQNSTFFANDRVCFQFPCGQEC
jgi:hypothetical protein